MARPLAIVSVLVLSVTVVTGVAVFVLSYYDAGNGPGNGDGPPDGPPAPGAVHVTMYNSAGAGYVELRLDGALVEGRYMSQGGIWTVDVAVADQLSHEIEVRLEDGSASDSGWASAGDYLVLNLEGS